MNKIEKLNVSARKKLDKASKHFSSVSKPKKVKVVVLMMFLSLTFFSCAGNYTEMETHTETEAERFARLCEVFKSPFDDILSYYGL